MPTNFTSLDFDQIKANLIAYLQSQSTFQDYNFAGSALSVLINLLAFNTESLAFTANMSISEAFLDSAVFRNSAVSLAKLIGYTPGSKTSAQAILSLQLFPNDSPTSIVIPSGTQFTTSVNGTVYTFSTLEPYVVVPASGLYNISDVQIFEGAQLTYQYIVDTSSSQKYLIPNAGVDTSTIQVTVQQAASSTLITSFSQATDINVVISTSNVYFLQEDEDNQFELIFGDGVIGAALADGNIVKITYLVSSGSAANAANLFELTNNIAGYSGTTITCTTAAFGGGDEETIDSIKFHAPLNYEAQDRAVTSLDYQTLIRKDFPNIDAIKVWGGEDNIPPVYGQVFVSIKPTDGFVLTQDVKSNLINTIIKARSIVSIQSQIVDPSFIFIVPTTTVKFESAETTLSAANILSNVQTTIQNFFAGNLNTFDAYFRFSKFSAAIDGTDPSIQNSLTLLQLKQVFTPSLFSASQYVLSFSNALSSGDFLNGEPSLSSTAFNYAGSVCYFSDDGEGNIFIYKLVGATNRVTVTKNVGTINYSTGVVTINAFLPTGIPSGTSVSILVKPELDDVYPVLNQIITIDPADISVSVIDETLNLTIS